MRMQHGACDHCKRLARTRAASPAMSPPDGAAACRSASTTSREGASTVRASPIRQRLSPVGDDEQAWPSCGDPTLGGRRRFGRMLDFALGDSKNDKLIARHPEA
jgi:hypothetical protein